MLTCQTVQVCYSQKTIDSSATPRDAKYNTSMFLLDNKVAAPPPLMVSCYCHILDCLFTDQGLLTLLFLSYIIFFTFLFQLPFLPTFQVRHKVKCRFDEIVSVERTGFELGTSRFLVCIINHNFSAVLFCSSSVVGYVQ